MLLFFKKMIFFTLRNYFEARQEPCVIGSARPAVRVRASATAVAAPTAAAAGGGRGGRGGVACERSFDVTVG